MLKKTDDAFKTINNQVLAFAGVKDNNELTTLFQTQTKTYADQLQATLADLTKAAENSQASGLLKDLTDKVNSQVAEWKKENPEVATTADNYTVSLFDSLNKLIR